MTFAFDAHRCVNAFRRRSRNVKGSRSLDPGPLRGNPALFLDGPAYRHDSRIARTPVRRVRSGSVRGMNRTEKLDGEAGCEKRGARHDLQKRIHFNHIKSNDAALGWQSLQKLEDLRIT